MSAASSSASTTILPPMMYSDELRRSVLIRNAMRTASTISSSRSARSAVASSSFSRGSASSSSSVSTSPSLIKERWSMMASRAGVDYYTFMDADNFDDEVGGEDNESEEDEYDDYSEEEERHHESPTHRPKCTLCEEAATRQAQVAVVEATEETDESVWFDDLLQEVSIEDYERDSIQAPLTSGGSGTAEAHPSSTSPSTQSHSFSSTSSLPSLIVDDDDYSGEEEEEDEIEENHLTAYHISSQAKQDHHSTRSSIPDKHTPSLTLSSPSSTMLSPP